MIEDIEILTMKTTVSRRALTGDTVTGPEIAPPLYAAAATTMRDFLVPHARHLLVENMAIFI
jgi:hypothetical protein